MTAGILKQRKNSVFFSRAVIALTQPNEYLFQNKILAFDLSSKVQRSEEGTSLKQGFCSSFAEEYE